MYNRQQFTAFKPLAHHPQSNACKVRIVLKVNRNLVQHQALAVLRWTAAVDCRLIRQLEHCRIMTCIADHVEIRVAECIREQLTLGIPAFEEQDYLAFFKDWNNFIEELAGKPTTAAEGVPLSSHQADERKKTSAGHHSG